MLRILASRQKTCFRVFDFEKNLLGISLGPPRETYGEIVKHQLHSVEWQRYHEGWFPPEKLLQLGWTEFLPTSDKVAEDYL